MLDTTFLEELASKAPVPGGGGASAYGAALASSLASMVANLTVGKKKYAEYEQDFQELLVKLTQERAHLIDLVDQDAQAFYPLSRAYGLPSDTDEARAYKHSVMQEALVGATEVPLEIMRSSSRVIEMTEFAAKYGSKLVLSDAGVAAVFARAALLGASLNVYINCASITDEKKAQAYKTQADALIEEYVVRADAAFELVKGAL